MNNVSLADVLKDVLKFEAENTDTAVDMVNHPPHYTSGKVECIEAIKASLDTNAFRGYLKGNIMKYLWRHEKKNGLQDLEKAHWYLESLIETFDDKGNVRT